MQTPAGSALNAQDSQDLGYAVTVECAIFSNARVNAKAESLEMLQLNNVVLGYARDHRIGKIATSKCVLCHVFAMHFHVQLDCRIEIDVCVQCSSLF